INLRTKDASDFLTEDQVFGGRQTLEYSSNGDGLLSSTILAWKPDPDLELLFNYIWREQDNQIDSNEYVALAR
ncbi:MAG: ligand-gated channel, partial [Pseudomonadota bacterium]